MVRSPASTWARGRFFGLLVLMARPRRIPPASPLLRLLFLPFGLLLAAGADPEDRADRAAEESPFSSSSLLGRPPRRPSASRARGDDPLLAVLPLVLPARRSARAACGLRGRGGGGGGAAGGAVAAAPGSVLGRPNAARGGRLGVLRLRSASLARASAAFTRSRTSRNLRSRSASSSLSCATRSASAARCSASWALASISSSFLWASSRARSRSSRSASRRRSASWMAPESRSVSPLIFSWTWASIALRPRLGPAPRPRASPAPLPRPPANPPPRAPARSRASSGPRPRGGPARTPRGPLLSLEPQPLGLLAKPDLAGLPRLLLRLAAGLIGRHLDQLLGLLLGALDAGLGVALELLRAAQALLRLGCERVAPPR